MIFLLISLRINEIYQFNNLEESIIDKYNYSNSACPNCYYLNEKIIENSVEYFYKNIILPKLISFEIVFKEYNELNNHHNEIIKLFNMYAN